MKKIFALLFAAASMMTAVSCNRAFDEKEVPSDGTIYITRTYEAGFEASSKTFADASGKVNWEQGDVIRYYSVNNGTVGEVVLPEGGARAQLPLEVAVDASYLVCVHGGFSISNPSADGLTIVGALNNVQSGVFGENHVALVKTSGVNSPTLTFHNIVSYYKFTFIIDDVKSVVFKSNDGTQLHGYGNINVVFDGDEATASLGSGGESKITVNNGGRGTFYIAALPGTLQDGFTIDCYDSSHSLIGSVKTTKPVELKPNSILNLGVLDTRISQDYMDLSAPGTANSYIVSETGFYKFKTVKGNSSESVGSVASAEVLWETFGTDVAPVEGELVDGVYLDGDYINFRASDLKGNAVIAAKDASGTILWSWHIWLTDQPVDQVYNNGAGTMMDRNLGATSATPGDVHALGLLYQWGRKDPFPGRRSYAENAGAAVSRTLPSPVDESTVLASNNTSSYAQSHPTTFITSNASNSDWYCNDPAYRNDALWGSTKTVNDPCPKGYRVPDGGPSGIFSTAAGSSANITGAPWDEATSSMDMSSYFGNGIWYPAGVCMLVGDGAYAGPGYGHYFTTTVSGNNVFRLFFSKEGALTVSGTAYRGRGNSVRCYKESSTTSVPVTAISLNKTSASIERGNTLQLTATITPTNATNKTVTWSTSSSTVATVSTSGLVTAKAVGTCTITATSNNGLKATCAVTVIAPGTDLSASGTANSYIVSAAGTYKIKTVKGNSTTSVGTVASASVLWESFGTSTKPAVGDLISGVKVEGNYITFTASAKKGNAVIAAKNSSGTILWSWHIWLTDKPADQVYKNSAGTMMDRNLGATSATAGSVGALGLLYQWGRKDPFMSYSAIGSKTVAVSTISWPAAVVSNSTNGTTAYSISHPTTFIKQNSNNYDWYYSSSSSTDNTRWKSTKGLYDPCPPGYRVPDGGLSGIWYKAYNPSQPTVDVSRYNSTNKGCAFNTLLSSSASSVWYPCAGGIYGTDGDWRYPGQGGTVWSCSSDTQISPYAYYFSYGHYVTSTNSTSNARVYLTGSGYRADGHSVRCQKQ